MKKEIGNLIKSLMNDETFVQIVKKLVKIINENITIDLDIRKGERVRMRYEINKLFIKYDYPSIMRDYAVQLVIRQIELKYNV